MYNEKYRNGGGLTPYVAPDISFDENKEVVYDDSGFIKAVREKDRIKNEHKADKMKWVKFFIIFFGICLLIELIRFIIWMVT